jgi:hypothetical protein
MDKLTSPMFVDQGIEGNYVTYHPEYSPEDDDPLQGIRFVASSSLGMPCVALIVWSELANRFLPSRSGRTNIALGYILYRHNVLY